MDVAEEKTEIQTRRTRQSSIGAQSGGQTAAAGGGGGLRGAFEEVMRSSPGRQPRQSLSMQPEWYLAIDGDQSGPFNAMQAQDWIREQPATAELFCWAEGFDDWLAVEDVDAFKGVRSSAKAAILSRPGSQAGTASETHSVSHTSSSSSDRVASQSSPPVNENGSLEPVVNGTGSSLTFAPGVAESAGPDLDIDDASRVVKLPIMPRGLGDMSSAPLRPAGLPGVTREATAQRPVLARNASTVDPMAPGQPAKSKGRGMLIAALVSVTVVAGLVAFIISGAANDEGTSEGIVRDTGINTDFGQRLEDQTRIITTEVPAKPTRGGRRNPGNRGGAKTISDRQVVTKSPSAGGDILELPGGGTNTGIASASEVVQEINRKVNQKSVLFTRCHERALKKDPLLRTTQARVTLRIGADGTVKEVDVPNTGSAVLGGCLNSLMKRWKVSQSESGVTTQLTINFARR